MTYHFRDIKEEWKQLPEGKLGYDLPLGLANEYSQKTELASVALNIGYHIGMEEAEKSQPPK